MLKASKPFLPYFWGFIPKHTELSFQLSKRCFQIVQRQNFHKTPQRTFILPIVNNDSSKLIPYNFPLRTSVKFFNSGSNHIHLIKVPKMGDSITEGTISTWKKKIGETVIMDEVICVIETDKVSVDIHADIGGKIVTHAAQEGETVYVDGDLVSLDTSGSQEILIEKPLSTSTTASTDSETPKNTIYTKKTRYIPMIQFPNRSKSISSKSISSIKTITRDPSSHEFQPKGSKSKILKLDYSPFPSRVLTDEEIEVINLGVSHKIEVELGKWKSTINKVA